MHTNEDFAADPLRAARRAERLPHRRASPSAAAARATHRHRNPRRDLRPGPYTGPGRRIAEVLENGPLDRAEVRQRRGAGTLILAVERRTSSTTASTSTRSVRQQGRRARAPDDTRQATAEEEPTSSSSRSPAGAQNQLLYERWVRTREALVEEAVRRGRLGYAHIRGMNDCGFPRVLRAGHGQAHTIKRPSSSTRASTAAAGSATTSRHSSQATQLRDAPPAHRPQLPARSTSASR